MALCNIQMCNSLLTQNVIQHGDIDECDRDLSINAQCTDTMGSYNCTCNIDMMEMALIAQVFNLHFNKLSITISRY